MGARFGGHLELIFNRLLIVGCTSGFSLKADRRGVCVAEDSPRLLARLPIKLGFAKQ